MVWRKHWRLISEPSANLVGVFTKVFTETLGPLTLLNELGVKKVMEFARNDHARLLALSEHQCRTEEMEKFVYFSSEKRGKIRNSVFSFDKDVFVSFE